MSYISKSMGGNKTCNKLKIKIDSKKALNRSRTKSQYSNMSKTTSHHFTTADDAAQAEARALSGEKKGNFRIKDSNDGVSMIQQVKDYYQRLVNEVNRGERNPIKLGKWKSVETHYDRFILERIAPNFAQFGKNSNGVSMALIPASFTAPHPTIAEKEAYMSRWNEEGDLYKSVMAECRKHNANDMIDFIPQVIHSLNPKSLLMICVIILVIPK